jgi:uncharacterized membrane protein YbhN (UPF0104 family)
LGGNNGKPSSDLEKIARYALVSFISIAVLLGVIEKRSSLLEFIQALLSVNVPLFFLSNVPYFIQALIMGLRLKMCFERLGKKITFKNAFLSHLSGMFFSDFSMGRTGYLAAALPVDASLNLSLGVVSTTIAVDAIFKGVAGGVAIFIFSILFFQYEYSLAAIAVSAFMAGGGIIFLLYVWREINLLERVSAKIPVIGGRLATFLKEWRASIKSLKGFVPFLFVFPTLGLILRGFEWSILASACGFQLSVSMAMLLHPMLTILRLIPFTLSGLGVVELALITLLPQYPAANLITFGILDMINNAFVDAVGLPILRKKRTIGPK